MNMKRIRKAFGKDEINQESICNIKSKIDCQMIRTNIITY